MPPSTVPSWLQIAHGELSVHEVPGAASNARILEYHAVTKLHATSDAVPWCSAFACWCMEKALGGSPKSARAFDWLTWGDKVDKPIFGCVVVLKRGEHDGHVGFYEYETDTSIAICGGNQADGVNISKFSKDRIIGLRMPPEILWKRAKQLWHPPMKYPPEPGYEARTIFLGN